MTPTRRLILPTVLAGIAATLAALPALAGAPLERPGPAASAGVSTNAIPGPLAPTAADSPVATGGRGTSQGAPGPTKTEQNPCQTQLVEDLKECEDEFCPNVFSCNHAAQAACIAGAQAANQACLNK